MVIGKSERKRKFRKRRVRSGVREELDSLSEEEDEKERARPPKPKPPVKIPDKPLISPLSDTEISEGLERYVFLIFNVKGSHGKEGVHGGGEGGGVLGRKELGCFKFRLKKQYYSLPGTLTPSTMQYYYVIGTNMSSLTTYSPGIITQSELLIIIQGYIFRDFDDRFPIF